MPLYDFKCENCGAEITHLIPYSRFKAEKFACEKCENKEMKHIHKVSKIPMKTIPLVG